MTDGTGGASGTGGKATGGSTSSGGTTTGGTTGDNRPPTVTVTGVPAMAAPGATVMVDCEVSDPDGDSVTATVAAARGMLATNSPPAAWTLPREDGGYTVSCIADDGMDMTVALATVRVPQVPPTVQAVTASPPVITIGGRSELNCEASDPNQATALGLTYAWTDAWEVLEAEGRVASFSPTSGKQIGDNLIQCQVTDNTGLEAEGTTLVRVLPAGLTSYHRLNGNLTDQAANPLPMELEEGNAAYIEGFDGAPGGGLDFDGDTYYRMQGAEDVRDSWTFAAWIYVNSASAASPLFLWSRAGGITGGTYGHTSLWLEPISRGFALHIGSDIVLLGNSDVALEGIISARTWTHLAVTYDFATKTVVLYLNGSQASSEEFQPRALTGQGSITLAAAAANGSGRFEGRMDEVQVYNVPLEATYVEELAGLGRP